MSTHESDVHTFSPELPAMFDGMKLAVVATVLYVVVRCLNLKSPTAPPELTFQDMPLNRFLLKSCPLLTKEWVQYSAFCLSIKLSLREKGQLWDPRGEGGGYLEASEI